MPVGPLPFVTAGFKLLNKSRGLLNQYQQLPPEYQQRVCDQGEALRTAITEMTTVLQRRRDARQRLVQLAQGAEAARHPGAEFRMANALYRTLGEAGPVLLRDLDGLAERLGADDAGDPEFTDALRIASDDGRVSITVLRREEALAATTSESLGEAGALLDTQGEERAIMRHLETCGIADIDVLSSAARTLGTRDRRFVLALTRLLERGDVSWVAARRYGLSTERVSALLFRERDQQITVRRAGMQLYSAARALSDEMKQLEYLRGPLLAELAPRRLQAAPASGLAELERGDAATPELSDSELSEALASLCGELPAPPSTASVAPPAPEH